MCGRYTLSNPQGSFSETPEIDARFLAEFVEEGWLGPRYNIAPTQDVPVITNEGSRRIERMRWGLVPFWANDIKIGNRMINARGETVAEKPAFRSSFKTKRCLIPASGFYEWKREGKTKTPMHIRLRGGGFYAMAGLYDRWKNLEGEMVSSCTIITTSANELMAPIHDRMPVILSEEAEAAWINLETDDANSLLPLIGTFPAASMEAYEVSSLVNAAKNQGVELLEPAESGRLPGF
ncbi:MAG: SOS response-associated peptidase [Chloroflexi bacterium]|nr:SOS response-associated peptidase [Chloroflexota bacterium]